VYYNMYMKIANIAELRNRISEYLALVEEGEEIEVRKRNVPIARIMPALKMKQNKTRLGCGKGTGSILSDPTEPFIPAKDWEMLKKVRTP
jgi:prevent-host-death family protein